MRRFGAVLAGIGLWLLLLPDAHGATQQQSSAPDRRALIIGISDYQGRTVDTVGGAGDAADLREALLRNGWPDDRIRVLADRRATAGAIRDGLRWLADSSTEGSFSVFHYSGHVKQIGGDRDRDGEALDEYLWSADNQFIADAELAGWVRRIRGRAWVDIAGCEAAGFNDGIASQQRVFTASSGEPEKSFEHPEWRNSIFVGLLVDQALLGGAGDGNGDRRIAIQEAFSHAAAQAPRMTARQRPGPQHPELHGGDGTLWYLDHRPPPPAKRNGLLGPLTVARPAP